MNTVQFSPSASSDERDAAPGPLHLAPHMRVAQGGVSNTEGPPASGTPPTLVSSTPADNNVETSVDANIVLTFSEAVLAGSGNIVVSDGHTQSYLNKDGDVLTRLVGATDTRTLSIGDSQIVINGNTVTINLTDDLKAGRNYSVTMASGVLHDSDSNAYAGLKTSTALNFKTVATGYTAPTAAVGATIQLTDTGTSDTDYITNSAAQTIHGTYSGVLNTGAGEFVQVSTDNGASWLKASASAGVWFYSGATISDSSTLLARVSNLHGQNSGTASQAYVYDHTAPAVDDIAISDTDLTAGETATVTITLTEAVNSLSLESTSIASSSYGTFTSGDGGLTWTATVTPHATTFASDVNDCYQIVASDVAGNAVSLATSYHTPSYAVDTRQSLLNHMQLSPDTGVSSTDLVTKIAAQSIYGGFLGTLEAGSSIQISLDSGNSWSNVSRDNNEHVWYTNVTLLNGTHTILARIIDNGQNVVDEVSQTYTLDTTAPATSMASVTVDLRNTSDSGISDTDNVTSTSTPSVTIDVTGKSGFAIGDVIQVVDSNHAHTIVGSYTITADDMDHYGGTALSFTSKNIQLSGALSEGTHDLTVQIGDAAGNAGAASDTALSVRVDTMPAAIVETTPTNNDTGVSEWVTLTVTFNENIHLGSNTVVLLSDGLGHDHYLGGGYGSLQTNGATLTITLDSALEDSSNYAVTLSEGSLVDDAGNVSYDSGSAAFLHFTTHAPYQPQDPPPGTPVLSFVDSSSATGTGEAHDGITNVLQVDVSNLDGIVSTTWSYSVDAGSNWTEVSGGSGSGSFNLPTDTIYAPGDILVKQTNNNNNVSSGIAMNTTQLTVDTTAYTAQLNPAGVSGFDDGASTTVSGQYTGADNNTDFNSGAEIVEVTFDNGATWVRATTSQEDVGIEHWSATGHVTDVVGVRISDAAGNISNYGGHGTAPVYLGSSASSTALAAGQNTVLYAGAGDDNINLSATDFGIINGGSGSDTLTLTFNHATMGLSHLSGIDTINMGTDTHNSLTVGAPAKIIDLTDHINLAHTLTINGDSHDRVLMSNLSAWTLDASPVNGYNVYHDNDYTAVMLIAVAIVVVDSPP